MALLEDQNIEQDRKLTISNREYFSQRGRFAGERDLVELARTATREGAWYYYECADIWHHPQVKRRTYSTGDATIMEVITPDPSFENDLSPVHYHTHPLSIISYPFSNLDWLISRFSAKQRKFRELKEVSFCFPTKVDLIAFLNFDFDEIRIVTAKGVTAIRPTDNQFTEELNLPPYIDNNDIFVDTFSVGFSSMDEILEQVNYDLKKYFHFEFYPVKK